MGTTSSSTRLGVYSGHCAASSAWRLAPGAWPPCSLTPSLPSRSPSCVRTLWVDGARVEDLVHAHLEKLQQLLQRLRHLARLPTARLHSCLAWWVHVVG